MKSTNYFFSDFERIKENNRIVKNIINIKRRPSRYTDALEETV